MFLIPQYKKVPFLVSWALKKSLEQPEAFPWKRTQRFSSTCVLTFMMLSCVCSDDQLALHNEMCVALANLQRNITKSWFENRTSPNLVMAIEVLVCWFLYRRSMSSQLCSLLSVE